MTLDRHDETSQEDAEHGVLSDAGSVDTASISLLGPATAQFRVDLGLAVDDDLDDDDDVIGDEIRIEELVIGEVVLEDLPASLERTDSAGAEDEVHDAEPVEEAGESPRVVDPEAPAETVDAAIGTDSPLAAPETAPAETFVVEEEADHVTAGEDAAAADAVEDVPAAQHIQEDIVDEDIPSEDRSAESVASDDVSWEEVAIEDRAPDDDAVSEAGGPTDETVDDAAEPAPVPTPVRPVSAGAPVTRREAHHTDSQPRIERQHASERIHTPEPAPVLASKRLGEFEANRESSDLLTPDRLLDPSQRQRPEPEGLWQQLVYSLSGHRINLGDGRRAKERKELDRRIAAPLTGGARFVPVLSRKGGVGKTTVTALLGMALADARDDRVIAVDANPDRGTLADRIARASGRTVRDLARAREDVTGYNDISSIVARDETRLDVLSSDADPRVSEAFNDRDYHDVASLAAHYYSLVLTDTGTGIVHSVMGATLEFSDQIVVVAGLSVDEARLASETLTWLETNGYAEQVRNAVVVLNNARPGTPLVRESELEAHFGTRVRAVVRVPYDAAIATGSAIVYRDLNPATRRAARELAASVVEGLRVVVQAA